MLYDLLARLQNACMAQLTTTYILYSKYAILILEKLKQRGYIKSYNIIHEQNSEIIRYVKVSLNYLNGSPIIGKIGVVSKPSQKVYIKYKDFMKLNHRNNLHQDFLLSTSKGILWLDEAVKLKTGGEMALMTTLNYKAFNKKQGGQ